MDGDVKAAVGKGTLQARLWHHYYYHHYYYLLLLTTTTTTVILSRSCHHKYSQTCTNLPMDCMYYYYYY